MTTIYVKRRIRTEKDAEALPVGTIATCPDDWPVEKSADGLWGGVGYSSNFLAEGGDWIALIPVEAEEVTKWDGPNGNLRRYTRLVTPWAPVTSP